MVSPIATPTAAIRLSVLPPEILDRIAENFCHTTQDAINLLKSVNRESRLDHDEMINRRLKLWPKAVAQVRSLKIRPDNAEYARAQRSIETACLPPYQLTHVLPPRSKVFSYGDYPTRYNRSYYFPSYNVGYTSGQASCGSSRSTSQRNQTLEVVVGLLICGLCTWAAIRLATKACDWHYLGKKRALVAGSVAKGRLDALKALEEHADYVGLSPAQRANIVNAKRKQIRAARFDTALAAGLVAVAVGFATAAITAAGLALGPGGACLAGALVVGVWYARLRPNVMQMDMSLAEARDSIYREAWAKEIDAIDQIVHNNV